MPTKHITSVTISKRSPKGQVRGHLSLSRAAFHTACQITVPACSRVSRSLAFTLTVLVTNPPLPDSRYLAKSAGCVSRTGITVACVHKVTQPTLPPFLYELRHFPGECLLHGSQTGMRFTVEGWWPLSFIALARGPWVTFPFSDARYTVLSRL